MYGTQSRSQKFKAAAILFTLLLVAGGLALAGLSFTEDYRAHLPWMIVSGVAVACVGMLLLVVVSLLIKIESNTYRLHNQFFDAQEAHRQHTTLLARIAENSSISDAAKALANRSHEWEMLKSAIDSEVRIEQWDAALNLVDNMENRFGTNDEVQHLRRRITTERSRAMRRKMDEAIKVIDALMDEHDWDTAHHEIDRLQRALPDEPRVEEIRKRLTERTAAHKADLMTRWKKAVEREEVDDGIKVLSELDGYLTREEAKQIEETARSVFKAKLMQLGMQFRFAVKEQRWRDALEIGVQIGEEFPNSRMAQEVGAAMDGLRKRAGLTADVEITASRSEPTPR